MLSEKSQTGNFRSQPKLFHAAFCHLSRFDFFWLSASDSMQSTLRVFWLLSNSVCTQNMTRDAMRRSFNVPNSETDHSHECARSISIFLNKRSTTVSLTAIRSQARCAHHVFSDHIAVDVGSSAHFVANHFDGYGLQQNRRRFCVLVGGSLAHTTVWFGLAPSADNHLKGRYTMSRTNQNHFFYQENPGSL